MNAYHKNRRTSIFHRGLKKAILTVILGAVVASCFQVPVWGAGKEDTKSKHEKRTESCVKILKGLGGIAGQSIGGRSSKENSGKYEPGGKAIGEGVGELVGNAVCPAISKAIGKIADYLEKKKEKRKQKKTDKVKENEGNGKDANADEDEEEDEDENKDEEEDKVDDDSEENSDLEEEKKELENNSDRLVPTFIPGIGPV